MDKQEVFEQTEELLDEYLLAAEEESGIEELSGIEEELLAADEDLGIDEEAIEEFHQATEEFVDVLSDVCEKYEIESEDIEALDDGLEKVWDSVTMSEDVEEPDEAQEESDDEILKIVRN